MLGFLPEAKFLPTAATLTNSVVSLQPWSNI